MPRQQLDQTRSHVRQASEALQAGQTQQAAAAGARAEQQLEKLRDQFRKQAAGRFNDEMREMREDARRLEKNEQQLEEQLAGLDQPKTKSLRESSGREQVREGLEQQSTQLNELMDQMRKTVEEAESTEPLLSKQLYETIRQAHQQRPGEALDTTRQLLERGFIKESRQFEAQAKAGIGRIKQGIERAAESVLGDESEAIRRAQEEVNRLASAIDEEIRRATNSNEPSGRREPPDSPQKNQDPSSKPQENQQPNATDPKAANGQPQKGQPGKGESGNSESSSTVPGSETSPKGQATKGQPAGQANQDQQGKASQQAKGTQQTKGGRSAGGGLLDLLGEAQTSSGPLTGDDFRPWADRLRDVEEMLDDPQLRAEAAKIRDRASAMRAEFKRHSQQPNWELVRETISKPLAELRSGSRKNSSSGSPTTRSCRSTATRCLPAIPSRCAAITNDWGAANDLVHTDLGCARMVVAGLFALCRGACARSLELPPRARLGRRRGWRPSCSNRWASCCWRRAWPSRC